MRMGQFGLLASVVISSPALAQGPSAQSCNALANTIAAGYTSSFSDRDFKALRYYATCESNESSSSGGLSIGYSAFSLGANFSGARSSQLCQQSREDLGIHDTEYNYTKVIFTQALATIDRCLELAAKSWNIKYTQVGTDAVALTLSNGATNGGRLLGAEAVPPASLVCNPALPSAPVDITSGAPFSTICYRTPNTQLVDGVQLTSAQDATIDLRLDDGPFLIPLRGYQSSVLQKLQQRIDVAAAGLAEQVAQLRNEFGPGRILAIAEVRNGQLVFATEGTSFDPPNGTLSFRNPKNLKFVPVVSYITPNGVYATEYVYSKSFGPNSASIWQGALDTGGRNHPPRDFTAVILGF
jgi:hypothetical protein